VATRQEKSIAPKWGLGLALAAALSAAVSLLLAGGAWADSRPVFVYSNGTPGNISSAYTKFGNATGRPVQVSSTMPTSLAGNACAILNVNSVAFTDPQKGTLAEYVRGGGTVIAIGEHSGFGGAIDAMNSVSTALGAHMTLNKDNVDPQTSGVRPTTTSIESDPLTQGVQSIRYAATATLNTATPARPLFRTLNSSGSKPFFGAEDIGQGRLVLGGDSNVLGENSDDGYTAHGNGRLAQNLCGGGSGSGGGGVTERGSIRRGSITQVICNYLVATARDTCTATVGDAGPRPPVTPAGEVRFASQSGGVFVAGNTCQLRPTPLSPGVASCAVEWQPPPNAGFPSITAEYLGSAQHATSNAITRFLFAGTLGGIMGVPRLGSPSFFAAPNGGSFADAKRTYGTRVSYVLRAPARVRFRVERRKAGKLRCPKAKRKGRKNAKRKKCSRYKLVKGSFTLTGKAGRNSFRFRGRMGGRKLKPGRYRLVATPFIGKAKGKVQRAKFRIKRP
jgi:hypothetical protein